MSSPFTHFSKSQLLHQEKHPTPLTYSEPTRTSFPFWLIFILWSLEGFIQLPTKCSNISLVFIWSFLSYCKYFYDNRSGQFWRASVNFPNESPLLHLSHVSLSSKHYRMIPSQGTYVCVLFAQMEMISLTVRAGRSGEHGMWKHTASWNTCLFYTQALLKKPVCQSFLHVLLVKSPCMLVIAA